MKNKYTIHVSMPSTQINSVIEADEYLFGSGRLNLYKRNSAGIGVIIASYPAEYTILEKIEKNE